MPEVSLAFGLAIVAAAYVWRDLGGRSEPGGQPGHCDGRAMGFGGFVAQANAQILGAVAGAGLLYLIASGRADFTLATNGLGQNGFGPGHLGE